MQTPHCKLSWVPFPRKQTTPFWRFRSSPLLPSPSLFSLLLRFHTSTTLHLLLPQTLSHGFRLRFATTIATIISRFLESLCDYTATAVVFISNFFHNIKIFEVSETKSEILNLPFSHWNREREREDCIEGIEKENSTILYTQRTHSDYHLTKILYGFEFRLGAHRWVGAGRFGFGHAAADRDHFRGHDDWDSGAAVEDIFRSEQGSGAEGACEGTRGRGRRSLGENQGYRFLW